MSLSKDPDRIRALQAGTGTADQFTSPIPGATVLDDKAAQPRRSQLPAFTVRSTQSRKQKIPPKPSDSSAPLNSPRLEDGRVMDFVKTAELQRSHFLRLARRFANQAEDAEDIVQQAMFKGYRKLAMFRGDSQMKTWLSAIVVNTAREFLRSQRGKLYLSLDNPSLDGDCQEHDLRDGRVNPEDGYSQVETKCMVVAALGGLGKSKRQIVEMCLIDEMPYLEVAAKLNITLSSVKSRMFRCRRDLRIALAASLDNFT